MDSIFGRRISEDMRDILISILTIVSLGSNIHRHTSVELNVKSPAFENEREIPMKYTCEGENVQPPLSIANLPGNTVSVAVIAYDADADGGHLVHWLAFNIEPNREIPENSYPGTTGLNDKGEHVYFGPCPPIGDHAYHFQVYALDTRFDLNNHTDEQKLKHAMNKHILGYGEIVGYYRRKGLSETE